MAKWTISPDYDTYQSLYKWLDVHSDLIGRSVYEGAKIVTDAIRANIEKLPTDKIERGHKHRNPTVEEKEGMLAGLGIAPLQDDNGFLNVKVGMDGYNTHVTEKYPQGHPNAMVARAVNSGSTFMVKHPFIMQAVNATKAKAVEGMVNEFDRLVEEKKKKLGV